MFNVQGSSVALLFGGSLLGDVVYEDGAGEKQSNEEHFAETYRTYVYIHVRRRRYLGELPAPSSPACPGGGCEFGGRMGCGWW